MLLTLFSARMCLVAQQAGTRDTVTGGVGDDACGSSFCMCSLGIVESQVDDAAIARRTQRPPGQGGQTMANSHPGVGHPSGRVATGRSCADHRARVPALAEQEGLISARAGLRR